ncbi:acetyltransferase [Vibrio cholerae]|nr:acetyltransferase [Vibrio cholerae]
MVAVVVFEFSGMRCQPLRRALGSFLMPKDCDLFSSYALLFLL